MGAFASRRFAGRESAKLQIHGEMRLSRFVYKRTLGYRNLKVLAETQDCKPGSRVSTNRDDSKLGNER